MPRCAVLGRPVAHSLSPAMHRAAYAELGLTGWSYDAVDLGEGEVAGFLAGLDGSWRGLSVTMPLKRAVIAALDRVAPTAEEVGAVNTVTLEHGRRHGDNTDVPGAVAALRERGVEAASDAVVIGAGATAASMIAALRRIGLREVTIAARDARRAAPLADLAASWGLAVSAEPLDGRLPRRTGVLVSTVPAAAVESFAGPLVRNAGAVLDAIYDPWPTALADAAGRAGLAVVSGLDLLAHQATLQVGLFTGGDVPPDVLRAAALAELDRRRPADP